MKIVHEVVAKAFDGKVFYGDNRVNECLQYEQSIIDSIEKDMIGNVKIYNLNTTIDVSWNSYINFINEKGKELFIKWCESKSIEFVIDSIHKAKFNKWYRIYDVYDDGYVYCIRSSSIDEYINSLNNLYNKMSNNNFLNTSIIND